MRTAVLADIHSNLEALQACLSHARAQGADRYAFLGDIVGYNADPLACIEIVQDHVARGAVAVLGNHDEGALGGLLEDMNFVAREAIYWTRAQLGPAERAFLAGLPLLQQRDGCSFVHASAEAPQQWTYIDGNRAARECIAASAEAVTFAGHVHQQALYYSSGNTIRLFHPVPGAAVPLLSRWRWLALAGSVGQPRDGNPAAAYVMHDSELRQLNYFRLPYDYRLAARKVRAAGLPERLAMRLEHGS